MIIIPAIDILNGKCVRLTKGDYNLVTAYSDDPVKVAKDFELQGVKKLHVVDLDGAKAKKLVNFSTIKAICDSVKIPVQTGGGIRTKEDLDTLFNLGVSQAIIGSLAVTDPDRVGTFRETFGTDRIQVSIDVLDGTPRISGWLEKSSITLEELISNMDKQGITQCIVTDISRDGTLTSPNFQLYKSLVKTFPRLCFTASGGVSSIDDLKVLQNIGISGVIIGKAVYEKKLHFPQYSILSTPKR